MFFYSAFLYILVTLVTWVGDYTPKQALLWPYYVFKDLKVKLGDEDPAPAPAPSTTVADLEAQLAAAKAKEASNG